MKIKKRVYLRAFELNDYLISTAWRNDSEVTKNLGGNTFFVSSEREKKWIENAIYNDQKNFRFAICLCETNKYIGNISLLNVNWINRDAEFSIVIGDKNEWNKGYGNEASIEILDYGFKHLNLHRIYLKVLSKNKRAIKLDEKIGFIKEGVLREAIFKNNQYHDLIIMSILRDEYFNNPIHSK